MSTSRSNIGRPTFPNTLNITSFENSAASFIGQLRALLGVSRRDGLNSYSSLPLVRHRAGYAISTVTPVRSEELTETDFIIALMGPTGAGKSTFLQIAAGQDSQNSGIGHGLESCTSEVTALRISFTDDINVVLVDTPGFDDTYLSDLQILEIIANWLKDASRYELCGLLYLHRVSDNRMSGTPSKNLKMFQKLCGPDFIRKAVLMTTMWPESEQSEVGQLCIMREEELRCSYWQEMINRGSTILRFKGTQQSAWSIIDHLVTGDSGKQWIRIQEELVEQRKRLIGTDAGQQLHGLTGELVQRQADLLRRMTEELKKTDDPEILQALLAELGELRKEKKQAERDLRQLDSSIVGTLRRIFIPTRRQNPLKALKVTTSAANQNRGDNDSKDFNSKEEEEGTGRKDRGSGGGKQGRQDRNTGDHEAHDRVNKEEHAHTGGIEDVNRNNQSNHRSNKTQNGGGGSGDHNDGGSPPPRTSPKAPRSLSSGMLSPMSTELLRRSGQAANNHRKDDNKGGGNKNGITGEKDRGNRGRKHDGNEGHHRDSKEAHVYISGNNDDNKKSDGGVGIIIHNNDKFGELLDPTQKLGWQLVRKFLSNKLAYKSLLESAGSKAQTAVDILQKLLESEDIPKELKRSVLHATTRLSAASGVYPHRLELQGVSYEDAVIASGGFGEVRKGIYKARPICLKVARSYASPKIKQSYAREAIAWSQLNHPNALPFYGISYLDKPRGCIGLVSPWMQNGNVNEYLNLNPDVPRLPLVHDVLAGLVYLHEESIVHGDLKGANILISPGGSACLADFGLSSVNDPDALGWTSLQTVTQAGGTMRWRALELFDEVPGCPLPRPTFESDVYSVASVMYEVLTGQVPYYETKTEYAVMRCIIKGEKPSRPLLDETLEFSDRIWALMQNCWNDNPSERPAARQVAKALRGIPQPKLTISRIAGHGSTKKRKTGAEDDILPALSFRGATRGFPRFSEDEIDFIRGCEIFL